MRIAITRVPGKESRDSDLCRRYGHECYTVSPLTAEVYPDRIRAFADAANRGEYDCIFFTSALPARLIAPLLARRIRIIAIGPQTARALAEAGVDAEMLPSFYSRDFVPFVGSWLRGRRVGIPRADVPNPALLEAIAAAGGSAEEVRCYSLQKSGVPLDLAGADALLFTSALSFREAVWDRREGLLLMAIGERTAEAMRERGIEPAVVGDGSIRGTLRALAERAGEKR